LGSPRPRPVASTLGAGFVKVLLFSNLYPCESEPLHGSFVRERTERLAQRMGFDYQVLRPCPRLISPLGKMRKKASWREDYLGRTIHHVRYPHVPVIGWTKQDERMVRGVRNTFRSIVSEFAPDLVDAHYLYPDALAAIRLSREVSLPCVATARGTDVNVLALERRIQKRFVSGLQQATAVAAVSPALAGILERELGLVGVHVTPNGVDLEQFRPATNGEPPKERIVSVGRLVPGKAIDYLVEALALEPKLPRLELIGSGPEEGRLRKLAAKRGVADRVLFHGSLAREELAAELSLGGIFAFPSRREGWPNAVLEALACGLPVCASATGGIPDILGRCGYLIPLEAGPDEWARTLWTLQRAYANDPAKISSMARQRAEKFSWESSLDLSVAFFEEALR
jgi:glycosyltransferase involved in cell wall biosynthesis